MANLQYIGARYVPIVYHNPDDDSAAWKSGVPYENLVIVTYLNDSYTSRMPVPASVGDPASNPDYWAKTGDFNAALTALQNQVNNIDNVEIPAIQSDVTDLEESREFNISHKRYVLIGDSLGTGNFTETAGHGWIYFFKSALGLTEGVDVFSTAIDGKGWTTSGDNFLTMAQALTVADSDTITDVIVLGGLNDNTSSFNTVWSAANTLYSYLHNRFKNAAIRFGVIGRSRDTASVNDSLEENVIPAIKNSNAFYIDGSNDYGHDYWRYRDTWHWNENYSQVFAILLAANKGAKVEIDRTFTTTTYSADSEFSTAQGVIDRMSQKGNQIIIESTSGKLFQYSTDKTYPAATEMTITLGTMKSFIAGNGRKLVPVNGFIGFSAPTADFHPFSGYLSFEAGSGGDSTVKMIIPAVFAGDTSFVSRTVHNFVLNVPSCEINDAFC